MLAVPGALQCAGSTHCNCVPGSNSTSERTRSLPPPPSPTVVCCPCTRQSPTSRSTEHPSARCAARSCISCRQRRHHILIVHQRRTVSAGNTSLRKVKQFNKLVIAMIGIAIHSMFRYLREGIHTIFHNATY